MGTKLREKAELRGLSFPAEATSAAPRSRHISGSAFQWIPYVLVLPLPSQGRHTRCVMHVREEGRSWSHHKEGHRVVEPMGGLVNRLEVEARRCTSHQRKGYLEKILFAAGNVEV